MSRMQSPSFYYKPIGPLFCKKKAGRHRPATVGPIPAGASRACALAAGPFGARFQRLRLIGL
jgi:hypothetical protein